MKRYDRLPELKSPPKDYAHEEQEPEPVSLFDALFSRAPWTLQLLKAAAKREQED